MVNDTAPSGDRYNFSAVEVLPPGDSGGGPATRLLMPDIRSNTLAVVDSE